MENSAFCVSTKADGCVIHPIECDPTERQVKLLKVRGPATPSDNLQWYDLCNTSVATAGCPVSSTTVGELWISYDITFYKPQLYSGILGKGIYMYTSSSTSAISTTDYFGASNTVNHNSLDLTVDATTITFPDYINAGTYQLQYTVTGDSTAVTVPTITLTSGAIAATGETFTGATYNNTGTTTTKLIAFSTFDITADSAVITFSSGTLPTNPTLVQLSVIQLNPV
jgi:hypothetical protein